MCGGFVGQRNAALGERRRQLALLGKSVDQLDGAKIVQARAVCFGQGIAQGLFAVDQVLAIHRHIGVGGDQGVHRGDGLAKTGDGGCAIAFEAFDATQSTLWSRNRSYMLWVICCAALRTPCMSPLFRLPWISLMLLLGATAAPAAPARWDFVVSLQTAEEILSVQGCSAQAQGAFRLRAGSDANDYLLSLRRLGGVALRPDARGVRLASWKAGECFEARVDLKAAGRSDRYKIGRGADSYWRVPPEKWFWRPRHMAPESTIEFRFPAGWAESVPWTPVERHRYRIGATPDDWPAQTAFGRFKERIIDLPGGRLRVALLPLVEAAQQDRIFDWFQRTAPVLLASDGRTPLPNTQILIVPLPGVVEPVPWGQVSRGGAAAVALFVGAQASARALQEDWTTAHELAHLQHPYLGDSGRWLAEGLASYYQNVWRARSAVFSAAEGWRRLDAGFQRGRGVGAGLPLSELGRGWGGTMRVYWAGAAYWMESDIALRQHGSSLDQVLGAFRRQHLPSERYWSPSDFIQFLDDQAPQAQLMTRYQRYASARQFPDLADSYRSLGLRVGKINEGMDKPNALRDAIMRKL